MSKERARDSRSGQKYSYSGSAVSYFMFLVLFYLLLFRDYLDHQISFFKYIDECIAVLAVPIFIMNLKKNNFRVKIGRGYGIFISLFLLIGLLSNVVFKYQSFIHTALPDAFLCVKFWLAVYTGRHIFSKLPLRRYANKIYLHIKAVTILYLVLACADWRWEIFHANIRYGLRSVHLMYSHPTVFSACCMFLIMILLAIKGYIANDRFWLALLLGLMCATLRSKAWGAAIAVVMICYFIFYRKKKFRLRTLVMFVPLMVALGWSQIEYYFFRIRNGSARYQLLDKAVKIAQDHFPLGAGFGTYGSYYSGVNYSPLYFSYGLSSVHGLREDAAYFISDSFWPMVLGQTGVFGLVFYSMSVIALFRSIQKIRNVSLAFYASALSGICYLLITSVAESAFVNPLAVPIAVWIGFLLGQSGKRTE